VRRAWLVFRRDYNEMIRTTAFRIMSIVTGIVVIAAIAGVSIPLRLQDWYGDAEANEGLNLIYGLVLYFLSLLIFLAFTWGFSNIQLTKEKVNGNIECLLATPVSPSGLWTGKILAVFLPAFIITLVSVCLVWIALNLIVSLPGWSMFIMPESFLIVSLLSNPVLFSGVIAFIVLVSLSGNPDIAVTPSFLVGFGLMMGIPAGMATGVIDMTSGSFVLWYTAGGLLVWMIVIALIPKLKRQTIVLSSKGG
jgi:ABC-type multidrug transport system permease subunit